MTESSNSRDSIYPLTGVRGLAAVWVVLYHYRIGIQQIYPDLDSLHQIISFGYLGVDLFAFLSGFIISYTYCDRMRDYNFRNTAYFLWLRFVRTYPLHLFILALFVLVFVYQRGISSLPVIFHDPTFVQQLFLVNGLGFETDWGWNSPSWSLSSEWLCYLLFPFYAIVLGKVRDGYVYLMLAVITIGGTAWLMGVVGFPRFDSFLEWGFLRIVGEFLTGCWLYGVYRSGYLQGRLVSWLGFVVLVGIFVIPVLFPRLPTVALITLFAMLIYCLSLNINPLKFLLGNRFIVYLGEISYSIYMLHWFILDNLDLFGFLKLPLHIRLWALLASIMIGAVITHHLVENTSRRYLRSKIQYKYT